MSDRRWSVHPVGGVFKASALKRLEQQWSWVGPYNVYPI